MTNPLVNHLEVFAKLARSEGKQVIEYLIRMAMLEAKLKKSQEQRGN